LLTQHVVITTAVVISVIPVCAVVYLNALASLAILRVARRFEPRLREALAAVTAIAQARATARCVVASGTLRTLKPKALREFEGRVAALSGLSSKVRLARAAELSGCEYVQVMWGGLQLQPHRF
jgi:Rpp14/Pop5 family